MKKFSILVAFVCVMLLVSSLNANVTKSEELNLQASALNLLSDEDYNLLLEFQNRSGQRAINFVSDKALKKDFDKQTYEVMRTKSAFVLGERAVLPLYIRVDSAFYKDAFLGSFSRTKDQPFMTVHPAAIFLAAKISHEIYHVRNPNEPEISAGEHEFTILENLESRFKQDLNLSSSISWISSYKDTLRQDIVAQK